MPDPITLTPIGVVRSALREVVDDVFGGTSCRIELDPSRFTRDALLGLDAFSHVEVVFHFDRIRENEIVTGARRPRGRADWPMVGIFAQRGKARPNRIGVTVCRLIEVRGLTVHVDALDAIDGTPVLDLKPYMREFAPRGAQRQPAWATALMANYWTPPRRSS
jgi:tRNA-Thr(GGU) m(6)t(6)A37 methyltransferase TsaA